MKIDFSRKFNSSYLILSGENPENQTDYRMKMITENQIEGFLPCQVEMLDGEYLFYYDITSKISLKTLFEFGKISKKLLENLFRAMEQSFHTAEQYLLPEHALMFQSDLIFTNVEQNRLWFCYYPGLEEEFGTRLKEFGEEILTQLNHDDREGVMLGYAFYQKCVTGIIECVDLQELLGQCSSRDQAGNSSFPLNEERRLERERILDSFFSEEETEPKRKLLQGFPFFRREKKEKVQEYSDYISEPPYESPCVCDNSGTGEYRSSYGGAGSPVSSAVMRNTAVTPISDTTGVMRNGSFTDMPYMENAAGTQHVANAEYDPPAERTSILKSSIRAELVPSEIWYREVEKKEDYSTESGVFILKEDSYVVGKSRFAADFVIAKSVVSRVHARLTWDGENYTVEDINSKNATYVNREMLTAGTRHVLKNGDELMFADAWYKYIRCKITPASAGGEQETKMTVKYK